MPLVFNPAELRKRRSLAGLSRRNLAEEVGLSEKRIAEFENGSGHPGVTPTNARRIARVLTCSLEDIAYYEEEQAS